MDFLHRTLYHNSVQSWLIAAAIGAAIFLALLVARRVLAARLGAIAARTPNKLDDLVVEVIARTRALVLLFVALHLATRSLTLSERIDNLFVKASKLVLLVQIALWGGAAIDFWALGYLKRGTPASERTSVAMIRALAVAGRVVLWVLIGIGVLGTFEINITPLITGLGVSGIAVALAVQNILGDLLAALAIVFDKPFDLGDTISVDQITGTVEHIGLKTTRLRSLSGEQVIIGNADLLKSRLHNFKRMYERRMAFSLDLPYETRPETLARIPAMVKEIVSSQSSVRFDRSHVTTFGASAIRVETVYYVLDPDYTRAMDVQQAINLEVLRRFAAGGISITPSPNTIAILQGPPASPITRGS